MPEELNEDRGVALKAPLRLVSGRGAAKQLISGSLLQILVRRERRSHLSYPVPDAGEEREAQRLIWSTDRRQASPDATITNRTGCR